MAWFFATCLAASFNVLAADSACSVASYYEALDITPQQGYQNEQSCLITEQLIGQDQSNLQIVEVHRGAGDESSEIALSLHLSVNQLINKVYLKSTPLLLLSKDFSRVEGERLCLKLREQGFMSVRVLVDGVRAYNKLHRPEKYTSTSTVTAKELIFEADKGAVVVIAESREVIDKLKKLGMTAYLVNDEFDSWVLQQITDNGLLPAVWVSDRDIISNITARYAQHPNFYLLAGSADSLIRSLDEQEWVNRRRVGVPNRYQCSAS
ncbi:hypothetical protein QWY82_14095 [Simiduia curdlanivorans]|uniref:Rhodanese domain-containing protein n=1 Tax=Simiduia curdlanivorans TaxID=1492769 RepID=A0ABV8V5L8_9GAMM|nr:hypothetical protein [Simiduia curdlanivorans]MDN3639929.1 hypothetical protein [Simiduia curdlanivorans]